MNDFVRLCALKTIADAAKAAYDQLRTQLRDELEVGDRRTARLDDGTELGSATHVHGKAAELGIVDRAAFLEWVKDHHDEALELKVRDWFVQQVLTTAKTTGELVPGVGFLPAGSSYVMAKQNRQQKDAVIAAWQDGSLRVPLDGPVTALTERGDPPRSAESHIKAAESFSVNPVTRETIVHTERHGDE